MKHVVPKLDAAINQLDCAIRLFIDEQEYICSITLAGAAEEIIGKYLDVKSAHKILADGLASKYDISEKIIRDEHLNAAKNWLKHNDKKEDVREFQLRDEAIQYIARALINLIIHDKSLPSEGPRFLEWIKENPIE